MSYFFSSVDILKHSLKFHFENTRNLISNISIIISCFNKFSNFLNFFFSVIIVWSCSINRIRFSGVIKGRNSLPEKYFIPYVSLRIYLSTQIFYFLFWMETVFVLSHFLARQVRLQVCADFLQSQVHWQFPLCRLLFYIFFEVSENIIFPVTNFVLLAVADIDSIFVLCLQYILLVVYFLSQ